MVLMIRRYMDFFAKDTEKVNSRWKTFYVATFALIAINAFCSAVAFHYMYGSFHYRCVLYVKPAFILKQVKYYANTTDDGGISSRALKFNELMDDIVDELGIPGLNFKVPNVPGVEVLNGRFWINNDTLRAQVHVDLRRTIFANTIGCEWVLFTPMVSFIVSIFLGVLIVMVERGGRGYVTDDLANPPAVVYPCLLAAVVMIVFYAITTGRFLEGMRTFCSNFREYTGQNSCTELMNLFAIQRRFGKKYFYLTYQVCQYSIPLGLGLWVLQLFLNILRILCAPDFQLTYVWVESQEDGDNLTYEGVHASLLNMHPVKAKDLPLNEDIPKLKKNREQYHKVQAEKCKMSTTQF